MAGTIVEKILSVHSGTEAKAGKIVIAQADFLIGSDTKAPLALRRFLDMELKQRIPSDKVALVIDHYVPCPHVQAANGQALMRRFAEERGCFLSEAGEGVSHQVVPEKGLICPGQLVIVADSHAATIGGLNILGLAVGSTELAAVLASGKMWFKVPPSIKVKLEGHIPQRVNGKDIALALAGLLGENAANYQCVEFGGSAVKELSIAERMNICNHMVDLGAKTAIMPYDERLKSWLAAVGTTDFSPVEADRGAEYARVIEVDVGRLKPFVALPHRLDNVRPAAGMQGVEIQMSYIGGCTNGRIEDLRIVAGIMAGKKVARGVRLFIVPASRKVYAQALEEGIIAGLTEAGAVFLAPGCALCVGLSGQGVPADGENVISTANRNFQGRLGNRKSNIYLASPATVAASSLCGRITEPGRLEEER